MQFKRMGRRIQVLAYRGYDKEKRRSIVKLVGSLSHETYEPLDNLMDNLTEAEKAEVKSYVDSEIQAAEQQQRLSIINEMVTHMNECAATLQSGEFEPSEEWVCNVWMALDLLSKVLHEAGYPHPGSNPR